MTEHQRPPGGQDAARDHVHIDVTQDDVVHAWAQKFDASAQQIRDAVQAVGPRPADVEMHLKGSHATTNAEAQADAQALAPGSTSAPAGGSPDGR